MTTEIGIVLFILVAATILFASERIRVDLVAMMVLVILVLTGLVTVEQAFQGFANPAVVTVWAIYIVSAGLTKTGVADSIAERIMRLAGSSEGRLIGVIMASVGTMSAFMNNIGATAVLLPAVVNVGRKVNVPASKLLIPLAFGSLLGGVTTLIGTPPNLLASTALTDAGFEGFSLLDFTPMGVIILFSSILYMVLLGRHLLPSRPDHNISDLTREYHIRRFLTELHILPDSPLVGKTLIETRLGEEFDLTVMGVVREARTRLGVLPNTHVRAGDVLLVKGQFRNVLEHRQTLGIAIDPHRRLSDTDLISDETAIAEVVVSQLAHFIGSTLAEADIRRHFGVTVIGIWREESPILGSLADVHLQLGDILLVHGRKERIDALQTENAFLVLGPLHVEHRRLNKAPIALAIFISMISLVLLGKLHISMAAVLGSVLTILTGCLSMDEAYEAIQWKSIFLIAGMLPMGIAMETTGTARLLADQIINLVGSWGPQAIMVGLFVLTTVLTAVMSNAAAAVLAAPIAISIAMTLNADPRAFVMGIAIAASNSFVTPIGHQACILVYGPGNYRFFDYAKVGLPLTWLIWILMLIFLPVFWPL